MIETLRSWPEPLTVVGLGAVVWAWQWWVLEYQSFLQRRHPNDIRVLWLTCVLSLVVIAPASYALGHLYVNLAYTVVLWAGQIIVVFVSVRRSRRRPVED